MDARSTNFQTPEAHLPTAHRPFHLQPSTRRPRLRPRLHTPRSGRATSRSRINERRRKPLSTATQKFDVSKGVRLISARLRADSAISRTSSYCYCFIRIPKREYQKACAAEMGLRFRACAGTMRKGKASPLLRGARGPCPPWGKFLYGGRKSKGEILWACPPWGFASDGPGEGAEPLIRPFWPHPYQQLNFSPLQKISLPPHHKNKSQWL